jgi:hypothetical protein
MGCNTASLSEPRRKLKLALQKISLSEINMNSTKIFTVVCFILLCINQIQAVETAIKIGRKVLVKDCTRLGINLGGDNYYSGAALVKKRTSENFEGCSYRQCHFGPLQDEGGAATWFRVSESWKKALVGGKYTILSGPAKGTTGTITDITTKEVEHKGKPTEFSYFVFDKKVKPGPPNGGLLVERLLLDQGQFQPHHHYWNSEGNRLINGDVPPGSFGSAALVLAGTEKQALIRFATHYQRYGETNGNWRFRFWAKKIKGSPTLNVKADRNWGESKSVPLSEQWTKHDFKLRVDKVPEPKDAKDNPLLFFAFVAINGEVAVDDIEIWLEGDTNSTVFRDDCVKTLKEYQPGILRYLQMGGNTLDNCLQPPLRAHSFDSSRSSQVGPFQKHNKSPYSLHEMYELCEYLDCEPWYCLPGTLNQTEMTNFMEYLGAPADVGYGKVRAQLGHPQPWTEVFDHIHVEFGNEAWNNGAPYQVGGYNGPDYWHGLIAQSRKSRYYKANVLFHAGGQAVHNYRNRGIINNNPNADRLSVAPYVLHSFSKKEATSLDSNGKLFRWAYAWPLRGVTHQQGFMKVNHELVKAADMELSVYEFNHHITGGDGPLEPRNKLVTSIGGGLNIANTMLHQLKDLNIRSQCLFSLVQHSYNAHGVGHVRLWGTALNMRKGHRRFRPTFLTCALANRVIGGDLIETKHRGANPTFDATGVFDHNTGPETLKGLPCLHSFAFRDGQQRGLLLINLDTNKTHTVRLELPGRTNQSPAKAWLIHADHITDNNEFEQAVPQVTFSKLKIQNFNSGWKYELPATSMLGIVWETTSR